MSQKRTWLWILTGLAAIFLMAFCFDIVINAVFRGVNMDTYGANGTFQLYNPLRRLAAGQIIGHDFPFFHGIAVPLLHFPVFAILGENVFAAETAKWLVSPLFFIVSTGIFFYAFFRNFKKTVVATGLFSLIALFWIDLVYPGNSLIGIRSTLPTLVAASLLWQTNRKIHIWKYSFKINEIIAVITAALAVPFGSEHGAAIILAYALLKAIIYYRRTGLTWISFAKLATEGISIAVLIFIIFSVLTFGHAYEALHYAFVDVPSDQGWYFGTAPNVYLRWDNMLPLIINARPIGMFVVMLAGILLIIRLKYKNKLSIAQQKASFLLLSYGVIVFVAGLTGYYFPDTQLMPLARVSGLLLVAFSFQYLWDENYWMNPKAKKGKQNQSYRRIFITSSLAAVAVLFLVNIYPHYKLGADRPIVYTLNTAKLARHADDYLPSSPAWRAQLDAFMPLIPRGSSVWSLYTSVYDSKNGTVNSSPGGEDYIIHTVGKEKREAYENAFIDQKPEFVITLQPGYFGYEEWLWSRHWRLYNQLITHYDLIKENGSHFLWKLREAPIPQSAIWQTIDAKDGSYLLPTNPTDKARVYEIKLKYKASANLLVPQFDRLPRYLINLKNMSGMHYPVSLPNYESEWTFPTIIEPGESSAKLTKEIGGLLPSASLDIKSVEYRQVEIPNKNLYLFLVNYCAFENHLITDERCSAEKLKMISSH